MKSERKNSILSSEQDSRFIIIYGKGVDDSFISDRFEEQNLEQVLHEQLLKKSFERAVFYSPHRSIFFLDEHSKELCHPGSKAIQGKKQSVETKLAEGPLGSTQLLPRGDVVIPVDSQIGDVHALRLLDSIIREENGPRTAIILDQAETTFHYFEDPRTLAGLIGEWSRLPAVNQNICVLIFSIESYQGLLDIAKDLPVPELRHYITRQKKHSPNLYNLVKLEGPDIKELERLIIFLVKTKKLKVAKPEFQKLSRWMMAENLQASQWIKRGRMLDKLDIQTATEAGWFTSQRANQTSAMETLESLIGLAEIKRRIRQLSAYARQNVNVINESTEDTPTLHMVFTGNPGTGKTTVARLIGELFHELDILKRGHLVEVRAADLIADHVGGTALKTNEMIDMALDGVLFIDEAYALSEKERGGYGQEAVDTLLTRLEDERYRLIVIVAGYPEKMGKFLSSNPGLRRRFPADNVMNFPDYSPQELWTILRTIIKRRRLPTTPEIEKTLQDVIRGLYEHRDQSFGNAGEIRNLADAMIRRRAERVASLPVPEKAPLTIEDLPEEYKSYLLKPVPDVEEVLQELDDLIGLSEVKSYIRRMVRKIQLERLRSERRGEDYHQGSKQHLVFCGAPGTGKTTVARLMGKILLSLGLLRKGQVIEVSRSDLVAGFVGQTALKTNEKIQSALDGLLFIDEAYALNRGGPLDFGQEAIDSLVKAMEDYRDRLVIIAAGYPHEMEDFLNSNPGLKSRFSPPILFKQFNLDELMSILVNLAEAEGFTLSEDAKVKASQLILETMEYQKDHFGYARTIRTIFEEAKALLAERILEDKLIPSDTDMDVILEVDIPQLIIPVDQERYSTSTQPNPSIMSLRQSATNSQE